MKHVIQPETTLSGIAQEYGTTVDAIMRANPKIKDRNDIRAYDTIDIPIGAPPAPKSAKVTDPDDTCSRCKGRGIKFLVDMGEQNGKGHVSANVDTKAVEVLPFQSVYDYELKNAEYSGRVDVSIDGGTRAVIPELAEFPPDEDGFCRVFVGSPGQVSSSHAWATRHLDVAGDEYLGENDAETLMCVETTKSLPIGVTAGTYDTLTMKPALQDWLVDELLGTFPPLFKQLLELSAEQVAEALIRQEQRRFLKDAILGLKFSLKGVREKFYVIFKGTLANRSAIRGSRYLPTNSKIGLLSTYVHAAKGNFGVAAKGVLRGSVLTFVLVGTTELAIFWDAVRKGEKQPGDWLHDVLVEIGSAFVKSVAASAIGVAAAAGALAAFGASAAAVPVIVVVGGGFLVSVLAGIGLQYLDDRLGVTESTKRLVARAEKFVGDVNLLEATESAARAFARSWSTISLPELKIVQLRQYILDAPTQMKRSSPAVQPNLIAAIMLDNMRERRNLRVGLKRALADTEGKFIEIYEGDAETFEVWALKAFSGIDFENIGLGLGHMTVRTVRDLVENGYLRREKAWESDALDISINWLTDEFRAPVLVGARLARISQYWYNTSDGEADISDNSAVLASLYGMGLTGPKGVHADPRPNEDGLRIVGLFPVVEALLSWRG